MNAQRHQTEKAIIDALMKICDIVKRTEINRASNRSTSMNTRSMAAGDETLPGRSTQCPTRSGYTQHSVAPLASNSNRATIHFDRSSSRSKVPRADRHSVLVPLGRGEYQHASSRSTSPMSSERSRRKSSRRHSTSRSSRSNKRPRHCECLCYTDDDNARSDRKR